MGPKAKDPAISADDARKILSYDTSTGDVLWAVNRGGTARVGSRAGCLNEHGYLRMLIMRRSVMVHRVVWLMNFGAWPDGEIDHIDGDRANNRIENLRIANRAQNNMNRRNQRAKRLPKGVGKNQRGDTYRARIRYNGTYQFVGNFPTADLAAEAYAAAAERLHGTFARTE